MLLERIERWTIGERHVAATLIAAGAKNVTLPVYQDVRDRLDAELVAEPRATGVDRDQRELMHALGVAS